MAYSSEWADTIIKKKKKQQEEQKQYANYESDWVNDVLAGKYKTEDIAPVKKKKRTWFNTAAFDDGYDFGDLTKSLLGTAGDTATNLVKGSAQAGEGLAKLFVGATAEVSDWVGQDEFADKLRNRLAGKDEEFNKRKEKYFVSSNLNKVSDALDPYSFAGEKTDDLTSSAGSMIAAGTSPLPWWVTMGGSSAGHELENAYTSGATSGEAWGSALISGASEVLFEKLSGGISFGGRTLDEGAKRLLSNAITNKTASTLARFGFDMAGEGVEEVLTEVTSNIGRKLTYEDEKTWGEVLASEEALDNYLEAFIGGAVMGGGFNTIKLNNSLKTGRDYDTGLTQNEQRVVDKEVQNRIAQEEANGKKLTNKQKVQIEEQVKNDLQRGYIDTNTIESTLGGETYNQLKSTRDNRTSIENQIKELENKKAAEITVAEKEQLEALREELKSIDTNTLETQLQGEMDTKIASDGYLQRSYQERTKKSVKFNADLTKYDAKQQKVIQKAIDSGILNDTNKTHDFVDMVAKISADKGINFDFTNNENLKNSGFAVEGKTVNGFINENGITLNMDSGKALNRVVGHEITHVLEGTDLYAELQQVVKEYAETKGDYSRLHKELTELYKDIDNVNIENELTADLIGDYLFTDTDFVNNLSTQKPSLFKKIYNEVKHLYKLATAGSKEARQLEKVKKTFEDAYKNSASNTNDANTKYSITDNTELYNKVNNEKQIAHATNGLLELLNSETVNSKTFAAQFQNKGLRPALYGNEIIKFKPEFLDYANLERLYKGDGASNRNGISKENTKRFNNLEDFINDDTSTSFGKYNEMMINEDMPMSEFINMIEGVSIPHGSSQELINKLNELGIETEYYNVGTSYNTKAKYSLTDNQGRTLTKEQQEYFKDSKLRDAKGNLEVVYHSTPNEFTVFDSGMSGENTGYDNTGFGTFVTTNKAFSERFKDIDNQGIDGYTMELFANVTNPIIHPYKAGLKYGDEQASKIVEDYYKAIGETEALDEMREMIEYEEADNLYDAYMNIVQMDSSGIYENADSEKNRLEEAGYDAIEIIEGYESELVEGSKSDEVVSSYAIFNSNQLKNIDNINPTTNEDIRMSLGNQDIAPSRNDIYGSDIKLQVEEAITPLQETVTELTEQIETLKEELAPVKQTDEFKALTEADLPMLEQQNEEAFRNIDESNIPIETEENIPVAEDEITTTRTLEDVRDFDEVGSRKVKAYQYENPEVRPYFQEMATYMLGDLENSIKGERNFNDQLYYDTAGEQGFYGTTRETTSDIAELLDSKYNYSYADIRKGLEAIIEDHGAENIAVAKRIEFALDKRLREGYIDSAGYEMPANQDYIKLLQEKEATDYYNNIPVTEAPIENVVEEDIAPVSNVSNTKLIENIVPVKEQVQQPIEENKNLTVKESNALKLNNLEKSLQKYNNDAEQSLESFNELILEKKRQYSSLKNRNTQSANKILQQITRLEAQRDNTQVEYERRMNNLQKRIDKMNSKEFKVAEQRMTKQQEYRQQARELIGDTSTWVDKKLGIQYQINTLKRNLRDIVRGVDGKQDIAKADAIYEWTQGDYNKNEAKLKEEYNKIVNPYEDMKLTNQEHVYTQMLGEYKYNPDTTLTQDIVDRYYNEHKNKIDVDKVNKAIESARQTYDSLFDRINESLRNQGMKELEYRRGYFPHFVEDKQSFIAKLFDWKVKNDQIPTDIAGLTELNNPERSWQSFNKHRESDITDYNFGKGLETYVRGALDWIYHIEDIQKRRALENEIRYSHSEKGVQEKIEAIYGNPELDADEVQNQIDAIYKEAKNPLNNFVTDLRNSTNNLTGKKSTLDRGLEYSTNRQIYSTVTNLSNRVSGNMIGGSISSALTNFIPITQSWGQVNPLSSLKAARETIANSIKNDGTIAKSTFLTNRLVKNEHLYKTAWDKAADKVAIMTDVIDSFTSQTVWRSKYNENIKNGMSEMEAIADADRFAENVMAGRSRGNEPTIFHSKNPLTKMFTAFQLEVNNQYQYMFKDMPVETGSKSNLVKGYATMFIGAYVYNALYSSLVGRDVAFDPIGLIEGILKELGFGGDDEEDEKTASEKFTAITEDLVQQLPFVGGLFGGGRVPISAAIPYENPIEMVKGTGTDLLDALDENKRERALKDLTSEWLKPVTYLALPFGGGQINKTIQGLSMYDDDLPVAGSYTNGGDLRFTADESLGGKIKAALFGRWASESAQDYVDSGFKTVKKSDIEEMLDLGMNSTEYRNYKNELNKVGKTTDKHGYSKYVDDKGNTYWYDKNNKTLYDSNYDESNVSVVDLEKASKMEQLYEYITGLNVSDEQKEIMFSNVSNTKTTDEYGYSKYVDDDNKTYWYDEETDTLYNSKYKEVDRRLLNELTEYKGKDMSNYGDFGSYEEFDYAARYPDKYNVISQIDTFKNYKSYEESISDIKDRYRTSDDMSSKQKTAISKQRKLAVQEYINSLDLSIPQKIMLEKMAGGYSIKSYENYLYGYINGLDMSAAEKQKLHNQLFD